MQPEWPADKVERRAVAALIPYARNARTHSAEQVDQIAASIREWGWTVPVPVDDEGGIIAGHGRVLAAHKLAIAEVPVMVAAGWSEAQKRAYVLADNKLALNAGWDNDLLKIELGDLQAFDFDLGLIGFSADEIAGLTFDRSGLTDPDEAPDAPAIGVSEPGDVWLLGRHRLVCGDCTDRQVVDKALNGVRELLRDPYWPLRAARELLQPISWPVQYLRAAPKGSQARVPVDLKNLESCFEEQHAIPER